MISFALQELFQDPEHHFRTSATLPALLNFIVPGAKIVPALGLSCWPANILKFALLNVAGWSNINLATAESQEALGATGINRMRARHFLSFF